MSEASWDAIPASLLGLIAVFAAWRWWKRRQADRYDLSRLRQTPLLPDEAPDDDLLTEESGPYCHVCDEAYPVGTSACRHCGRPLG